MIDPYLGLTIEDRYGRIVNVHFVEDGRVFFGRYERDLQIESLRTVSLCNWHAMFQKALDEDCAVYSLLKWSGHEDGPFGICDDIESLR